MFLKVVVVLFGGMSVPAIAADEYVYVRLGGNPEFRVNDFSAPQRRSMWCWAACTEMAYRSQGVAISQEQIVQVLRGDQLNAPGTPEDVATALTAIATDANGESFISRAGSSPRLDPPQIVALFLDHNVPLIIFVNEANANIGHVVLLTGVVVDAITWEPVYYRIHDPWPLDRDGRPIDHATDAVEKFYPATYFHAIYRATVIPFAATQNNMRAIDQLGDRLLEVAEQIHQGGPLPVPELLRMGKSQSIEYGTLDEVKRELSIPEIDDSSKEPPVFAGLLDGGILTLREDMLLQPNQSYVIVSNGTVLDRSPDDTAMYAAIFVEPVQHLRQFDKGTTWKISGTRTSTIRRPTDEMDEANNSFMYGHRPRTALLFRLDSDVIRSVEFKTRDIYAPVPSLTHVQQTLGELFQIEPARVNVESVR